MSEKSEITIVLVHGWSVYNTSTYGELASRLKSEASKKNIPKVDVVDIWLGKYVSFRDEVRVTDLALGFENALRENLSSQLSLGGKIIVITHSTGGPVIREWWDRLYLKKKKTCPMSHLIMLAPANFGSALAQLGKSRLSRVKSWFEGVEPGKGVLDWLELGSADAWEINKDWIVDDPSEAKKRLFQFVLTGQSIDRKLYDHLNSYSGELGSDGVVRVAAANLNASYVKLEQEKAETINQKFSRLVLNKRKTKVSLKVPFALIRGRSHSGDKMGILRSIKNDDKPHPTLEAIIRCIRVKNRREYEKLSGEFQSENEALFEEERLESVKRVFIDTRDFIHDRNTMIIFRVTDDKGFPVRDYDLLLTGKNNSPNGLPPGFFVDRQSNKLAKENLTYFLNYDVMSGCGPVLDEERVVRGRQKGLSELGLIIKARPNKGYVHYMEARLQANLDILKNFLKPHQTIMVDVELQRIVHEGVFNLTQKEPPEDFRKQPQGDPIQK